MGLVTSDVRRRWPGNCLVYRLAPQLSEDEKKTVAEAMTQWSVRANVRFVERSGQDRYVTFRPDDVPFDRICSSSSLGMAGGEQTINLDPAVSTGTVVHEIGHALGFVHEHKRRDRDPFIDVNIGKVIPEHRVQFEKVAPGEADELTPYDLRSIMHYGDARQLSENGRTRIITTDDPTQQSLIGGSALSGDDVTAANALDSGNHQVYQLTHHGQLETVVQQNAWTGGWSVTRPFGVGGSRFMFLLKSGNGTMHLQRINLDGAIGERVQTRDWSAGWTQAVAYTVGTANYMLLYKRGTGDVHIHEITAGGEIGTRIVDGRIDSGWTTAAAYTIGMFAFLLFSNSTTGDVRVYELAWDGKLGATKYTHRFSAGWTLVQPYKVLADTYLLMVDSASGAVRVRKLELDGSVGAVRQSRNWSVGWTTAIPYRVGPGTFLFCLKRGDGALSIRRIEHDGRIGPELDRRTIAPGFDNVSVYGVGAGTYVQLVRS